MTGMFTCQIWHILETIFYTNNCTFWHAKIGRNSTPDVLLLAKMEHWAKNSRHSSVLKNLALSQNWQKPLLFTFCGHSWWLRPLRLTRVQVLIRHSHGYKYYRVTWVPTSLPGALPNSWILVEMWLLPWIVVQLKLDQPYWWLQPCISMGTIIQCLSVQINKIVIILII